MKILFIITGVFSLMVGFVGIFLPILPTVPFLLLSATLFSKSSPRMYNWLMYHKIFGKYIRNYRDEKSIPLSMKLLGISMLWGSILLTLFFVVDGIWWLQLILVCTTTIVTIQILSIKTKKEKLD